MTVVPACVCGDPAAAHPTGVCATYVASRAGKTVCVPLVKTEQV